MLEGGYEIAPVSEGDPGCVSRFFGRGRDRNKADIGRDRNPGVQARAKLQLLAQAGERGRKIAQSLLRGGEYVHFRYRSIPLTQTA